MPFSPSVFSEDVQDLPADLLECELNRSVGTTDFVQKCKREVIRLELRRRDKLRQFGCTCDESSDHNND